MNEPNDFNLRRYVDILLRRKWWIVGLTLLCTVVVGVLSILQPKEYTASSSIVISLRQDIAGVGTALQDPNQLQNQLQTEARVVESPDVKERADEILGRAAGNVDDVSARGMGNTRILAVTVTSGSAEVARDAANAYSQAYLEVGERTDLERVQEIGRLVDDKRADLQSQIAVLQVSPEANATEIFYLQSQITQLETQFNNTQAQGLTKENAARVLAAAELPTSPSSPKPINNTAMAFLVGLLLSLAFVLIYDRAQDRIQSAGDIGRRLPRTSVLGSIPHIRSWTNEAEPKVITLQDPKSPAAEAYRDLRTNIEFMSIDRQLQVIQVVSAVAGEGKSTTAANLAVAFAWSNKKVMLVDGDLRRPRLHKFFNVGNNVGFTSAVLANGEETSAFLDRLTYSEDQSVQLLPSGPIPPNPAELLATKAVADIFELLREHFDVIIVDSPPLLPVADSLVLSSHCDGVVLVARAGKVKSRHIQQAVEKIGHSTTGLLGVVVNDEKPSSTSAYTDTYAVEAKQS